MFRINARKGLLGSIVALLVAITAPLQAQWLNYPTAGVPKTPTGFRDSSSFSTSVMHLIGRYSQTTGLCPRSTYRRSMAFPPESGTATHWLWRQPALRTECGWTGTAAR